MTIDENTKKGLEPLANEVVCKSKDIVNNLGNSYYYNDYQQGDGLARDISYSVKGRIYEKNGLIIKVFEQRYSAKEEYNYVEIYANLHANFFRRHFMRPDKLVFKFEKNKGLQEFSLKELWYDAFNNRHEISIIEKQKK